MVMTAMKTNASVFAMPAKFWLFAVKA